MVYYSGDLFIKYFGMHYMQCLIDGADEYLQLLDVASSTMRALCNLTQDCAFV